MPLMPLIVFIDLLIYYYRPLTFELSG